VHDAIPTFTTSSRNRMKIAIEGDVEAAFEKVHKKNCEKFFQKK
jgi:hypothetical protein